MPADEDIYPAESDRRRFVKGVVGASALTGLGVTGAVSLDLTTSPSGAGGGTVQYKAMKNTDGPAPRGMPQIPIEIDEDGYLLGIFPEYEEVTEGGRTFQQALIEDFKGTGVNYGVQWFQYCGVQSYAGIQPSADQDNYFRYVGGEGTYEWHADKGGEKVHVDDFADYENWTNGIGSAGAGKPAAVTWRSQSPAKDTIPVQIIRGTRVERMINDASGDMKSWLQAACPNSFIANLNKCTHFCCVPGFKATAGSAKFGAENLIYCPCHQSIYDPYLIEDKSFTALPRPDEE